MEIGSDLFNILISIGFLIFIFICSYLIYSIFQGQKEKYELERVKKLAYFQISIPKQITQKENQPAKDFRELISVAEQFFSSLGNLYEKGFEKKIFSLQNQISLEIISLEGKLGFYCSCSKEIAGLIEKQINSYWPTAQVTKSPMPNIFQSGKGAMIGANLKLKTKFILPIKTYKNLEADPLNSLTNCLSKLPANSGAAIQMVVRPISDDWRKMGQIIAQRVQQGKSIISEKWYMKIFHFVFELLSGIFHGAKSSPSEVKSGSNIPKQPPQLTPMQEQSLKALNEKVSKTGLATNIRMVVVAETHQQALMHLKEISTSFGQFSAPDLNGFKLKIDDQIIKEYILRRFTGKGIILNAEELASIFHLPSFYVETPIIEWAKSKELPPPTNLPSEGIILGESVYRGQRKVISLKIEDRRRHIFMIGKTGVGKTTLFSNMFEQDMKAGRGCCFVDPLGDAIEDLLGKVPENRVDDVILFDPSDVEYPMGLNLLEWQTADQRDFLIQEAIQIFYKLFDPTQMGIVGPQWEHWFRNAALTIMAQPGGGTLIDVPRIFTDDNFRNRLIAGVKDQIVKAFWTQQLAKTADFHKSEMYNYFISKFGRFTTNELMRNIIGQKKSAFNLRKLMDEGKILLINLSKGKIGEVNANLLGMILVSKIQMAAFSRADIPEESRRDFYLYVDEFQNFTTDSFASILSEARKYRLNLAITNQYIAQLTETIRDAVIGNVGTMICYRIGAADGEFLIKEFPESSIDDLVNLDKFNTYTKMLIDGTPTKPFSMRGIKSATITNPEIQQKVRQTSRNSFARSKDEIEKEIQAQISSLGEVQNPGINEPTVRV